MADPTLREIEEENTKAALRGDPGLLYGLLDWARHTREGLGEPELAESRHKAARILGDMQSKGALGQIKDAQQQAAQQATKK